jgi:hypothetical protein
MLRDKMVQFREESLPFITSELVEEQKGTSGSYMRPTTMTWGIHRSLSMVFSRLKWLEPRLFFNNLPHFDAKPVLDAIKHRWPLYRQGTFGLSI